MRVRLNIDQVERILLALKNDHLCNECSYNSKGKLIFGSECLASKLIKKFERVYSGSASRAGQVGGAMIGLMRREEIAQAEIKGINRMSEAMT